MLWLKLLVAIGAGLISNLVLATELERVDRQSTQYNFKPYWHYQFSDFTTPAMRVYYDGIKTTFCFRDNQNTNTVYINSCVDTQNYFQFFNKRVLDFAKGIPMNWLFYDDNKVPPNSGLSERNAYPAVIAVSGQDAYSIYNNTEPWRKTCEDCVKAEIDGMINPEVWKSGDGTFWASFNKKPRIITSQNMRNWTYHDNLILSVQIHNTFPIKYNGEDYWVLVQIVDVVARYYIYYVGKMSHERGFDNLSPPRNFTYGCDDAEVFFVSKGDVVDDNQVVFVAVVGDYFRVAFQNASQPIILGTPRIVTLQNITGQLRVVQKLAVDIYSIPQRAHYTDLGSQVFSESENPLQNIQGTKFTIITVMNMMSAQEVGIRIRKSATEEDFIQIGYLGQDVYYVDRGKSKIPAGFTVRNIQKYQRRFDVRLEAPVDRANLQFTIIADASLLEVFYENGLYNINLIILCKTTSKGMQLFTSRGTATLTSFLIIGYDN